MMDDEVRRAYWAMRSCAEEWFGPLVPSRIVRDLLRAALTAGYDPEEIENLCWLLDGAVGQHFAEWGEKQEKERQEKGAYLPPALRRALGERVRRRTPEEWAKELGIGRD